jgi:hypothetical protein
MLANAARSGVGSIVNLPCPSMGEELYQHSHTWNFAKMTTWGFQGPLRMVPRHDYSSTTHPSSTSSKPVYIVQMASQSTAFYQSRHIELALCVNSRLFKVLT